MNKLKRLLIVAFIVSLGLATETLLSLRPDAPAMQTAQKVNCVHPMGHVCRVPNVLR